MVEAEKRDGTPQSIAAGPKESKPTPLTFLKMAQAEKRDGTPQSIAAGPKESKPTPLTFLKMVLFYFVRRRT